MLASKTETSKRNKKGGKKKPVQDRSVVPLDYSQNPNLSSANKSQPFEDKQLQLYLFANSMPPPLDSHICLIFKDLAHKSPISLVDLKVRFRNISSQP